MTQEELNQIRANALKKHYVVGEFWFSQRQLFDRLDKCLPRLFCVSLQDGQVHEYTGMVDFKDSENPDLRWEELYPDAKKVCIGYFHHRE